MIHSDVQTNLKNIQFEGKTTETGLKLKGNPHILFTNTASWNTGILHSNTVQFSISNMFLRA